MSDASCATLPESSAAPSLRSPAAKRAAAEISLAMRLTETYRRLADAHPAEREAAILAVQFPAMLADIRPGDLFAGTEPGERDYIVKFSPQLWCADTGEQAGYCLVRERLAAAAKLAEPEYAQMAKQLGDFWEAENTWSKAHAQWDEPMQALGKLKFGKDVAGAGPLISGGGLRLGGMMLDYDTLVRLGLPGLRQRILSAAATADQSKTPFYHGLLKTLDVLAACITHYRDQAMALAENETDAQRIDDLQQMAQTLETLLARAPQSLREALQLAWLYSVLSGVRSYGRMDIYLGDFYAHDIDSGVLTEEQAMRLLTGLWQQIFDRGHPSDTRIFIGGMGRRNEVNADRFAMAAMEVTRRFRKIIPCLTLRFHHGQNPALMQKALDVVGEGCLYPMLYNDDVNVPAVQREFGVPEQDAIGYLPLGCGEYILDHCSVGSPNTAMNVGKCVEAALHNGRCAVSKQLIGVATGPLETFDTFEKFYEAVKQQVRYVAPMLAKFQAIEYDVERRQAAFLMFSLVTDDCISRGISVVDGGARYRGACVEGFGFTNAGDSLAAIKRLVYDQKAMTLEHLVAALDANFVGYEKERALLLAVPKFGNDDAATDRMVVDFTSFICDEMMDAGKQAGLDYLLISSVNPGAYSQGYEAAASADGRRCGDPYAIGNSPTAGRDVSGITALLNSIARTNPENGGFITNLKFSKDFFAQQRAKLDALLATFWAKGGFQANITVVGRQDLENALKEPEKYPHVLVRIGGWSARFIDIEKRQQLEILARTLY